MPGKRKPVTQESVVEELETVVELLNKELEKLKMSTDKNKNTRLLKSVRKKVEKAKSHIPKIKKKRNILRDPSSSGFMVPYKVSDELLQFMKLEKGTPVSRNDVQCALSAYIHLSEDETREKVLRWKHLNPKSLDLRDPKNKRIINPDPALNKLLRYNDYKKKVKNGKVTKKVRQTGEKVVVTDPSLEYYVIMRLIQHHFLEKV